MAKIGMLPEKLKMPKKITTCFRCGITLDNENHSRVYITKEGNFCSTKCKNSLED